MGCSPERVDVAITGIRGAQCIRGRNEPASNVQVISGRCIQWSIGSEHGLTCAPRLPWVCERGRSGARTSGLTSSGIDWSGVVKCLANAERVLIRWKRLKLVSVAEQCQLRAFATDIRYRNNKVS